MTKQLNEETETLKFKYGDLVHFSAPGQDHDGETAKVVKYCYTNIWKVQFRNHDVWYVVENEITKLHIIKEA